MVNCQDCGQRIAFTGDPHDCASGLVERLADLEAENARLAEQLSRCNIDELIAEAENASLRARIDAAPHEPWCAFERFMSPCNCWKSAP